MRAPRARGRHSFSRAARASERCKLGRSRRSTNRASRPISWSATSVGALNAAFLASRPQSPQTATELGRVWRELQRQDVFPLSMSALVGGVCGPRDHLVPDRELRRLIRRYIQFDDLADATIPLHLVAFDLIEGRRAAPL